MPGIKEFIVIEPPTSHEVQKRVVDMMLTGGLIKLIVKGVHEVPRAKPEEVVFNLKQTTHPEIGEMIIAGMTEDFRSVIVNAGSDSEYPAIGHMVTL